MLTSVEEHLEKSGTVNIKIYIYISDGSLYCKNVFFKRWNVGTIVSETAHATQTLALRAASFFRSIINHQTTLRILGEPARDPLNFQP